MAIYLSNRDGQGALPSLTNEEGHFRFQTKTWAGNILRGSGNELAVTQNSPLGMSVLIGTGDFKIDTSGYAYTGWLDAAQAVTITTANPSNPRIDAIVLYVDKSQNTNNTSNNPGIVKAVAVAGTPAGSPVAPDNTAITTAIGAANPYIRLANVAVGTGVTQITNANITSTRVFASVAANSVTSTSLAANSVTTTAVTDANVTISKLNGGSTAGVLTTDASGVVSILGNYSTSEASTNTTWINGKTIYKKTVAFGALPNNTGKSVAHGITTIERVMRIETEAYEAAGPYYYNFGHINTTALANGIAMYVDGTNVVITTGINRTGITANITIYYTKV